MPDNTGAAAVVTAILPDTDYYRAKAAQFRRMAAKFQQRAADADEPPSAGGDVAIGAGRRCSTQCDRQR